MTVLLLLLLLLLITTTPPPRLLPFLLSAQKTKTAIHITAVMLISFFNSIQFNSIQFLFINVPSQQPNGQLQKQHNTQTQINEGQ
jgi:fucose permease